MILVDSSVWIDHLLAKPTAEPLLSLIEAGAVITHPFIVGEVALGDLGKRRREILGLLGMLPRAPMAADDEVLAMIEAQRMMSSGVGYVDTHLLASARIGGISIWTFDGAMARFAEKLGVLYRMH